ncbi:MAG: hypothetical protein HFH60_03495 [Lachnospiraceae bacterium]|nr:hypothetical protein [Lachnospiraceae bacterium]
MGYNYFRKEIDRIKYIISIIVFSMGINISQPALIEIPDMEVSLQNLPSNEIEGGFYYNQLNDKEKENYNRILTGCKNFETKIPISDISLDSFYKVQTAFNYDNPQFFWTLSYTVSITSDTHIPVFVNYEISENDKEMFLKLNDLGERIIKDIPEEYTDFQKIKFIYDYIVSSTTYDIASINNQDIRSVLLEHSSICAICENFSIFVL